MTGAFRYERPVSGRTPGSYEQPGQPFSERLQLHASPDATWTAPACCWRAARPLRAVRWRRAR